MEAHRALKQKERLVDAMREQRDLRLPPSGVAVLPPELTRQLELLLQETCRSWSDDPQ